ncbi:MAG: tetratricopeptide repeat protein, partial [Cyanobacteria bacterium P01_H01_bin.58]
MKLSRATITLLSVAAVWGAYPIYSPAQEEPTPEETSPVDTGISQSIESYNEGVALFDDGNYPAAIAAFTDAINLNPSYAAAYMYRGAAYKSQGDLDLAIRDLNQAIA